MLFFFAKFLNIFPNNFKKKIKIIFKNLKFIQQLLHTGKRWFGEIYIVTSKLERKRLFCL